MPPVFDGNNVKNQDRYIQEPAQGLSALAVSKRCSYLKSDEELPLLWMLQQISWQRGGLLHLAESLIEGPFAEFLNRNSYAFAATEPAVWLADRFERACLSTEFPLSGADDWRHYAYRGSLVDHLSEYRRSIIDAAGKRLCSTAVSDLVFETLDNALEGHRSMSLCFGPAGIGKTEAARQWCEMHPGVARYVETPAVENDRSFYSAIAEKLGIPRGTSYNGQQTSLRIIDVLKESRLMLVLDEAQRLWPLRERPSGAPRHVLWLTSLVNEGVPVGLLGMPEFFQRKALFVKGANWSDSQFNRRLSMVRELPTLLSEDDLRKVARHVMPAGSGRCQEILVAYAQASKINLSAIAETLATARRLAKKAGREEATAADIQGVIRDVRAPMDCILAADPASLCGASEIVPPTTPAKRRQRAIAARVQPSYRDAAPDTEEEDSESATARFSDRGVIPLDSEVLPRQAHRRTVALSPVAR